MDGEESSDITVGFFRSGLERQAGWDSRTARVDMAGTVAMIDLRLPCPPAREAPTADPGEFRVLLHSFVFVPYFSSTY